MIDIYFDELIKNNVFGFFLYDTKTSVIEFSEETPKYIPKFAKALYDFKHKGILEKKINKEFRIMYCSCFIIERRIESIKLLSNLKPIGVFNYIFESYDWSPVIDCFRFYQLFNHNNTYHLNWSEIRNDIDAFTKSTFSIDDEVKRQIRFSMLGKSEDVEKIMFKNELHKKALIVMKSTSKKIDLNNILFIDFIFNPILLIGFKEEEFSMLKFQFDRISEGIYVHYGH